ncbi:MAG: hypothetical protein ACI8RD_012966 [Bacillariaceae sp.]|jgi:hypothetical protein
MMIAAQEDAEDDVVVLHSKRGKRYVFFCDILELTNSTDIP